MKVTGVPMNQRLYVDDVFKNRDIDPDLAFPKLIISRNQRPDPVFNETFQRLNGTFHPVLRGARLQSHLVIEKMFNFIYAEVYRNGLLEIGSLAVASQFKDHYFDLDLVTGIFAHLVVWGDKFRNKASSTSKYAIEVEICVRGVAVSLGKDQIFRDGNNKSLQKSLVFPKYELGRNDSGNDTVQDLVNCFQHDLFNSVGWHLPEQQTISNVWDNQTEKTSNS